MARLRYCKHAGAIADFLQHIAMTEPEPEPQAPQPPQLGDCCRSGCVPCVYDLYDDALERYQRTHAAWLLRQAESQSAVQSQT